MFQFNISQATLEHSYASLNYLRSELVLTAVLILVVFVDLFFDNLKKSRIVTTLLFGLGVAFSMYLSIIEFLNPLYGPTAIFFTKFQLYPNGEIQNFSQAMFTLTKQGSFFKFLMSLSALFLLFFNQLEFKKTNEKEEKVEYLVAILAILLGSFLMASASHFLSLLLAIEISSFGAYALIYFNGDKASKEASLKYILYGLMATGLMLFGMSVLYAETGSLSYNALISSIMVDNQMSPILALGISLLSLGLFFKLAVVPMYFWVPDTFHAGPMSGIAFLSLVPKFAALANLILLFSYTSSSVLGFLTIQQLLLIIGAITTTVGNFFALGQNNIKRLLGYSSVAHSGFLLIALAVFGVSGLNSLCFYALVYVFMNFIAFMLAEYYSNLTGSYDIRNWKGQGHSTKVYGMLFFVAIIALIGFPPTAGFSAKLFVFTALIELFQETSDKLVLIVLLLGAFNIVISLFYYLKIPFHLFFHKSEQVLNDKTSVFPKLQLYLMALPLIALFLFSGQALELVNQVNDIVKYFVQ
jgi:NADH-quinone oxidoreductase subunit N